IEAAFRIEAPRLIGRLARLVGDVGAAEDLAQDALLKALEEWPKTGIPDNPGAWLTAASKNRALDQLRHRRMRERKHGELERAVSEEASGDELERAVDEGVGDDLLR